MNKIFLAAIILAAIAFTGCEKETEVVNDQHETLKATPRYALFILDGVNTRCDPTQIGNCTSEVIITAPLFPSQISSQKTFFKNLILNSTFFAASQEYIRDGLQEGIYTIDIEQNTSTGIYYVMVLDELDNILIVIPYNLT
ncbi:MAG: hypothetical protein LBM67_08050 [Lentimicrobiaceae bacterium]|jgi:hypothetical protein|nr:hypothetical protein [Lentimicrobiaceae bacterium]